MERYLQIEKINLKYNIHLHIPRSGLYKVYERGDSLSGTDIWKYIAAFCFAGDICGNTGS